MDRSVVIDCFPGSVARYAPDHVVVAVDVIRASTMVVTAVALGYRCLLASDLRDAYVLRDGRHGALLAGELHGDMPAGFDMNNSPVELQQRPDGPGDLVVLSTSGTELMLEASLAAPGAFVACFRNYSATARVLAGYPGPIALIGAGSLGEFREEDQICCAWIAEALVASGHRPADVRTEAIIDRWRGAPASACDAGNSVAYLRRSGQMYDWDFIVEHVDDLELTCAIEGNLVTRRRQPTGR